LPSRKPKSLPEIGDNRAKLIDALGFVAFAASGHDNEKFNYVRIKNKMLTAADDCIAMSAPVDVDFEICLHGGKFKSALEQCGENFQFTQLNEASVSIKSEKFRAVVEAAPLDLLSPYVPDAVVATIDDRVKNALEVCDKFVLGKGDATHHQSAFLTAQTAMATTGAIAVEYWHGIDLPPVALPKRALQAISKIKKKLVGFGFSETSATFHYEDGSFVKAQLYNGSFPNSSLVKIYEQFENAKHASLFPEFFDALDALSAFISNDTIHFHDDFLATDRSLELGASYKVPGIVSGRSFSAKLWNTIKPYVQTVCIINMDKSKPIMFTGDNLRGLIMGKTGV
jgi:hypothetical protein